MNGPGETSRDAGVEFESAELTEAFHQFDELWRRAPVPADRLRALAIPAADFGLLVRGWHAVGANVGHPGTLSSLLQALGVGIKLGEARALVDPDSRWPEDGPPRRYGDFGDEELQRLAEALAAECGREGPLYAEMLAEATVRGLTLRAEL